MQTSNLNQKDSNVLYYIYRASRKSKDGSVLYAKDYGFKAWRIPIYKN